MTFRVLAYAAVGALGLAACSSPAEQAAGEDTVTATESAAATTDDRAVEPARESSATSAVAGKTLALEGLADLAVGKPVPAGSSFAERGAQINDTCRTLSSPTYPGVYAIVEQDEVRRITIGQRSDVMLIEGIGVGATEADVLAAFPGFRATPHKYIAAPGKYLTQPGNDPRLRFEIGTDGRVSLIHVGVMPQLGYVEGCA